MSARDPLELAEARGLVLEYIRRRAGQNARILDDKTRHEDFGWVFFYQSTEFLSTGDPGTAMVGNAPLIVDREGRIFVTGTALDVEHYIREFERGRLSQAPSDANCSHAN